jgi:hypothetical protein
MKTIQIEIDENLANRIESLTSAEKEEISKLISIWILKKKPRPILEVIDEVSSYAQQQGLTEEILDELLKKA